MLNKIISYCSCIFGKTKSEADQKLTFTQKIVKNLENRNYKILADYFSNSMTDLRIKRDKDDDTVTSEAVKISQDFNQTTFYLSNKKVSFVNFDENRLITDIYNIVDPTQDKYSRIVIEGTSNEICVIGVKMGCYIGVSIVHSYDNCYAFDDAI